MKDISKSKTYNATPHRAAIKHSCPASHTHSLAYPPGCGACPRSPPFPTTSHTTSQSQRQVFTKPPSKIASQPHHPTECPTSPASQAANYHHTHTTLPPRPPVAIILLPTPFQTPSKLTHPPSLFLPRKHTTHPTIPLATLLLHQIKPELFPIHTEFYSTPQ